MLVPVMDHVSADHNIGCRAAATHDNTVSAKGIPPPYQQWVSSTIQHINWSRLNLFIVCAMSIDFVIKNHRQNIVCFVYVKDTDMNEISQVHLLGC